MSDARLEPLTEADFETVARLGETIWRDHYIGMITAEQVEYMLKGRYTPEKLRVYAGAQDRWLSLLRQDGRPVGYCSWSIGPTPSEMKLEQLYLLAEMKGQGLGGLMLRHVEDEARAKGCASVWLTVNKGNTGSIAVYKKAGYAVREEAVFDIGNGFVMDDYVMEKRM
jgi:ribosomal protein S18 acetylase RimI-like enzyme